MTGAKNLHVADSGQARNRIVQVDVSVIGQKSGVVGSVWRVQGEEHKGRRYGFANGDSVVRHVCRKLGSRLRLARLGKDQVGVRIRLDVKIHDQRSVRVSGGVERVHVVHVVDAGHLLFDRGGNRLLECLCIRADVSSQYLNLWRGNIGELRNRQAQNREPSDHHQQN